MKANLMNSTIEMTKTEANAAGMVNSDEFRDLKTLREAYPTFKIVIVKVRNKVEHFKGLTCEYMEKYIKSHNPELLTDFYTLRGKDAKGEAINFAPVATYGEIKMWFLRQFPEIENTAEQVKKIVEEARNSRVA